jgi:hypothetical protein
METESHHHHRQKMKKSVRSGFDKGVIWYPFLVATRGESSMLAAGGALQRDELGIAQDVPEGGKRYCRFPTYLHFWSWAFGADTRIAKSERCFYEIISSGPQKPYFDVDLPASEVSGIKEDAEQVAAADDAATKFASIASSVSGIPNARAIVFSSNSVTKLSYHIIIDGVCLPSHRDNSLYCQAAMENAKERVPVWFLDAIDTKVYKTTQLLRMFGSCKIGTDREKIFCPLQSEWLPTKLHREQLDIFAASLVSLVASCLPVDPNSEYALKCRETAASAAATSFLRSSDLAKLRGVFVTLADANCALAIVKAHYRDVLGVKDFPFTIRDDAIIDPRERMIPLRRHAASHCPECNRSHLHENPFMVLQSDGVVFGCRRGDKNTIIKTAETPPWATTEEEGGASSASLNDDDYFEAAEEESDKEEEEKTTITKDATFSRTQLFSVSVAVKSKTSNPPKTKLECEGFTSNDTGQKIRNPTKNRATTTTNAAKRPNPTRRCKANAKA